MPYRTLNCISVFSKTTTENYSYPVQFTPPLSYSKVHFVKVKVMLRTTVSRPVWLGIRPMTRFLLISDNCGCLVIGRPLRGEVRSVVYNWCCFALVQSFLGASSAGLVTISYSLNCKIPASWKARFPCLYLPELSFTHSTHSLSLAPLLRDPLSYHSHSFHTLSGTVIILL